jgi:hypothetical protein
MKIEVEIEIKKEVLDELDKYTVYINGGAYDWFFLRGGELHEQGLYERTLKTLNVADEIEALQKYYVEEKKPLVDSFGRYLEMPKVGTEFYFPSLGGNIYASSFKDDCLYFERLSNGNMFDTRENALAYNNYKKAEMRLIKRMTELNIGWEKDYTIRASYYAVYYSSWTGNFQLFMGDTHKYNNLLFFESEEIAKQFINEMGDDLRIYFRLEG